MQESGTARRGDRRARPGRSAGAGRAGWRCGGCRGGPRRNRCRSRRLLPRRSRRSSSRPRIRAAPRLLPRERVQAENPPQPSGPATVRLVPSAPTYPCRRSGDRRGQDRKRQQRRIGPVPPALQPTGAGVRAAGDPGHVLETATAPIPFSLRRTRGAEARSSSASPASGAEKEMAGSGTLATFEFQAITPASAASDGRERRSRIRRHATFPRAS
jgi:hypothetical protein